jgi:MoxR-like ATPase
MVRDEARSAYVIRVNIHNHGWDGSICTDPLSNHNCKANVDFKAQFCAAGIPRCFFLGLFNPAQPVLRLPKRPNTGNRDVYQRVFKAQLPRAGDVAIFWGTFDGEFDVPVGIWEIADFSDTDEHDYVLTGKPDSVVRLQSRVTDFPILNRSVRRAVGGEMVRLLDPNGLLTVCRRWLADHQSELKRVRDRGLGSTDDVRNAVDGLTQLVGELPTPPDVHITSRPFERIDPELFAPAVEELAAVDIEATGERSGDPDALDQFPQDLVADYELAVEVAPLVVLAGPSGAGKTKLTQAYAEHHGYRYLLVAVRPDWRANEDLLGYLPPLGDGDYIATDFVEFVREAADEWERCDDGQEARRFHVCLDEMNLARPEYYLAEVLSKMELDGQHRRLNLYPGQRHRGFVPSVPLPPNLVIIGTVNNDDTTHALSPKVLDRSVYLHIDTIDLEGWFARRPERIAPTIGSVLIELDARLRPTGTRIGYRVANRILRWVGQGVYRGREFNDALDAALVTFVLTRIRVQRSEPEHREVLEQLVSFLSQAEAFPRSVAAVEAVKRRLERHEFAYGQFET